MLKPFFLRGVNAYIFGSPSDTTTSAFVHDYVIGGRDSYVSLLYLLASFFTFYSLHDVFSSHLISFALVLLILAPKGRVGETDATTQPSPEGHVCAWNAFTAEAPAPRHAPETNV